MVRGAPAVLLSALAALSVASAPSCGASRADRAAGVDAATVPAAANPPTAAREVLLTVWLMSGNPRETQSRFMSVIAPFLAANRRIHVVATAFNWDVGRSKIGKSVAGGEHPDVVQLGTTWLPTLAASGALMNLSGKYDESAFPASVLAPTSIGTWGDTRRFAMPWTVDTRALYYRKDACRQAGVVPERDFANWSSFEAALKKLNRVRLNGKRVHAFGMPVKDSVNIVHSMSTWIWGAGGDYLSPDGDYVSPDLKEGRLDTPEAIAGIAFYFGLMEKGLFWRSAALATDIEVEAMLARGDLATTISWPVDGLSPDDFGVAMIPKGPRGRFCFLGGSVLAIYKVSPNQDEALELLKFLAEREAQVQYARGDALYPATIEAQRDPMFAADPIRAAFAQQIRFGRSYPTTPQWGSVEVLLEHRFGELWDAVLAGSLRSKPRAALTERLAAISREVTEAVQSHRVLNGLR